MKKSTAPLPPKHLSSEAKGWWKSIQAETQIDDQAGILLLQSGLEAFDRMRQAQAVIKTDGLTTRDRFGQLRVNPAATVERDSRAAMLSALKALNLDVEAPTGVA